jgi:hypothetical protein
MILADTGLVAERGTSVAVTHHEPIVSKSKQV